ncbi:hypothetical protein [Aeromonas dhakensis]|uniref:hypothetical protein n=1 Tax=Aeromonas dhakensis TaxID=196024 RepID=UPI0035709714
MRDTFMHSEPGMWYFRILGYGIHFKNINQHPLLFSQRNGYRKALVIGSWRFEWLKPIKNGGSA